MEEQPTANQSFETEPESLSQETAPEIIDMPDESANDQNIAEPEISEFCYDEHVRDLALNMFDHTQPLHDLNEDSRRVFEMAALMHNLPIPHAKKKAYRVALQLVQMYAPQELSPEEQNAMAAIITCCQRKLKRKNMARLDLSPIQQREALTMAALLRIATSLDASGSRQTTIQRVEPARDRMWIVVDGPKAATDAAAAQSSARLWARIGYTQVKVLETAEAAQRLLPFPEPTDQVGIQPTDALTEAGRKVMRYQFAQMLSHEEETRLGEDIEALHDMRVATRRLRAAFEVFEAAFERGALKPHLVGLRATGCALGDVRDLDVFMEKAQAYMEKLPDEERDGLQPLLNVWQEQRQEARGKMLAYLDSQEYAAFKRKFNVFLSTPGAGALQLPSGHPIPYQVCELAPVLIYKRMASVRAFGPYLDDAPIERLHALRIEFKKLRYTVEYFREVLGDEAKEVVEDLKKLQDHLGDLNDAQVASQILRQFIDTWEPQQENLPISERQNIEAVVTYMAARHAERHRLMITFKEAWEHFIRPDFRRNLVLAASTL